MPADRLLATLLRSFQSRRSAQETSQYDYCWPKLPQVPPLTVYRLYSTAASLLITLSNPLNVTLLTSQILTAPAFWDRPDGLRTCLRVLGIFHSATLAILSHESAPAGVGLDREQWIKAVVHGADERSPRWHHLLAVGGVLLGFEGHEHDDLPWGLRHSLQGGIVTATNLALDGLPGREGLDAYCIALVLTHTYHIISDSERERIKYTALLPVLTAAVFSSTEGFQSGYFLSGIDADVVQQGGSKFTWSNKSPSFFQIQQMSSRPLFKTMGPLSRLLAHAIMAVKDPLLVQHTLDEMSAFASSLITQWRRNKLSEIDASEERLYLHEDALRKTVPVLWQVLKTAMFAAVTVLQAIMGRVLSDAVLADNRHAPRLAQTTLSTLRSLDFISSRLGVNAFSATTFVSLAAIDIVSSYPQSAQAYLREIRPREIGHIPKHPLDRSVDLYFLNTAEHLTLAVPPQMSEDLLVAAATPYLTSDGPENLRETFEAAHSVMLAVFSAPQNAELTVRTVPFYIDALFKSFPSNLSARQFRLAFKTLIRIASPPSPLAEIHSDLPAILLELVHHRALNAPTTLLPPTPAIAAASNPPGPRRQPRQQIDSMEPPLTEQAVLALALLDSLPFLGLDTLGEWLALAAELTSAVRPTPMWTICRDRFWEVLSSGEMDVDRASLCVAWWGTRGGREMVLSGRGRDDEGYMMHGGLGEVKQGSRI